MVGLNRKNLFILAFGSLVLAGCGGNDDVIADVSGGDTGATCGDSVCNADEKCVDGVCKPKDNADTGTKCGDSVCNADEECVDDSTICCYNCRYRRWSPASFHCMRRN